MPKRKENMTAADLMAKLNSDPDYLARRAIKEAEIDALSDACRNDESELVAKLNELGLPVDSVWDLVNNAPHPILVRKFYGSYEIAYPLLVEHLKLSHHPRIREGIIRALTEKSAKSIASEQLLHELEHESKQSHRWVIANALRSMLSRSELNTHPKIEEAYRAGYL
ncbi:MAG: hypothetical protein U1F46_08625 [Marinagarivorans sp.]